MMKKKKIGIILVCVILVVFIGVKVVLNVLVNDVNSITDLSPNLANISDGMLENILLHLSVVRC